MPRKLPPYVEAWTDRHGSLRVYFRKDKGPRVALPSSVGSEEFLTAYQEALAGRVQSPRPRGRSAAPGTIEALVQSYMQSPAYRDLRQTTKAGYISRLEIIRSAHGHRTLAGLTAERIEKAFLAPYSDRPGAALNLLKMLRVLIKHAIKIRWPNRDPSIGIKRPKVQEIRSWTDEEIAQFEARWPVGTKQRLAFALELYTAQRRSDVHRMTWADISGTMIRVVQQKTGKKMKVPLHRDLRPILDATEHKHAVILATEYGKPFTVDGFSGFMRDAITAAGLGLDCQPHGLRKTAGRRLAEAGCTTKQIMAVLGHKSLAEAERYTRDADQEQLATAAFLMLEGRNGNVRAQPHCIQFGKTPEDEGNTR